MLRQHWYFGYISMCRGHNQGRPIARAEASAAVVVGSRSGAGVERLCDPMTDCGGVQRCLGADTHAGVKPDRRTSGPRARPQRTGAAL